MAHFVETMPSFLSTTGTRQTIGQTTTVVVPSIEDRAGNLLDQASALEQSDPANGGSGVVGPYWAGLLSSRLGYTVTPGEPYYSTGCTDTTTCVFQMRSFLRAPGIRCRLRHCNTFLCQTPS